jgi:hypothetical protein
VLRVIPARAEMIKRVSGLDKETGNR